MLKSEKDFLVELEDTSKVQNQLSNHEVAIKLKQLIANIGY